MRNFQVFCGLIALIATGPSTAVPLGDRNEIPLGDLMCCLQKVSKAGATRSVQTHDIDCVLSERGTEESSGTEVQVTPLRTHAQDRAPDRLYINRVAHWSIAYPGDWIVDDHDPADVRIYSSAAKTALCGIHSTKAAFKTLDEFTDAVLAHDKRYFVDKGQVFGVLARTRISLPNNVIGSDVLTEIGPGGKSRRVYILADGQGFAIDCETYAKDWDRLAPFFERIIRSFALGN